MLIIFSIQESSVGVCSRLILDTFKTLQEIEKIISARGENYV